MSFFIWDLSLHSKAFYFFQSVSESQSFQTTVGEWQKPFWELDAAGQSDLCETVHKPGGSKGFALQREREQCGPHWWNCPEPTCLLSFAMAETTHLMAHGMISFPEVTWRNSRECWELKSSRRLGEGGLLPDACLGQKPASPLLQA